MSTANAAPVPAASSDIMPVVERSGSGNAGLWVFLAIVLTGGIGLFTAMSAGRENAGAPRVVAPEAPGARIAAPPPLALPAEYGPDYDLRYARPVLRPLRPQTGPAPESYPPARPGSFPPPPPATAYRQAPVEPSDFTLREPFAARSFPLPGQTAPTLPERGAGPATVAPDAQDGTERVMAGRFRNPAYTVPQGTVVPAVLETALDSTRPGAVRALVQSDIRAFDGSRVLIGRGSRLYGEYQSDLQPGQKRALIRWTRLIRPDGVTVALDSPASDPLGRAGVEGKVDGKFLQRFGGAILQSVLDIGVGVAAREATGGVVVALPGSSQTITGRSGQQDIQPTLKVRHGTSVSVFVARDLDFSSVETPGALYP